MRVAISSGKGFFSKTRQGKDCRYETRQMNYRKSYAPSLRAAEHLTHTLPHISGDKGSVIPCKKIIFIETFDGMTQRQLTNG